MHAFAPFARLLFLPVRRAFVLTLGAAAVSPAVASNFVGSGGGSPSGVWDLASNWSPSGIPDLTTTDVLFAANSTITGLSSNRQVDDFTTSGNLTFSFGGSGKAITVNGALTHSSGTLTMQASMGLVIAPSATAAFTGTVAMSNGAGLLNQGSMAFGTGALPTLDFTPVSSTFSPGAYTFRNDGAATFYSGTSLNLSNAAVVNTGALTVATGGSGMLLQSLTQTDPAGQNVTMIKGGTTLNANSVNLTAGTLLVNGTLNGSSTTLGTGSGSGVLLSPGDDTTSVAVMTLAGNAGTIGGSTWHFDLGGTAQGSQYDLINAWQNLNVGSLLLDVSLVSGFVPAPTDTFTIMNGNNISGMFTNASGSKITLPDVGKFDVAVGSGKVVLSNFTPVPEPAAFLLSGLGAAAALFRRRR